ncbi:MAG: GH116 family glycosyl-hydrolase, partial [Armatimonadota bacterium]
MGEAQLVNLDSSEITRRQFLQEMAARSAAVVIAASGLAPAQARTVSTSAPPSSALRRYAVTPARAFEGANLEAVAMPIGGIGTGTIWLDGRGRLAVWQIFNNFTEERVPNSFFAVRAQIRGRQPLTRVLQTVAEEPFEPVSALTFRAGYPIAELSFSDPELPIHLEMEALNPMIPLDARSSAIPCAIFRITAVNNRDADVNVSLLACMQNAVGCEGRGGIDGTRFPGYGGNQNRVVRGDGFTGIAMEMNTAPPPSGSLVVRGPDGRRADMPQICWIQSIGWQEGDTTAHLGLLQSAAKIAREGGVAVIGAAGPGFFKDLSSAVSGQLVRSAGIEVFEDFEHGYENWTVEGEAFGSSPHTGTSPGQQLVSGFKGEGLVNSYRPNDAPQGIMASKPFRIRKRFIAMLIGGGSHRGRTCVNLRVGGQVVRSATGRDSERLEPVTWDVSDLMGKEAVIEIVDRDSGPWGHILVDQIVFADRPPDQLAALQDALRQIARALPFSFENAETAQPEKPLSVGTTGQTKRWRVSTYSRIHGFRPNSQDVHVAAKAPDSPLLLHAPFGKGRLVMSFGQGAPWSWVSALIAKNLGDAVRPDQILPGTPKYGSMALAVLDEKAYATACWTDPNSIAVQFAQKGRVSGPRTTHPSPEGQTYNGALAVPFRLHPGEKRTVTFIITWHFPNVERFGRYGNRYSAWYPNALAVAKDVAASFPYLYQRTRLYRDTIYESNLPPEFLDAMTSQSVIFRGPTCYWTEDGYFAGFEGSYGCCPLNCTHVWNYAQTHARLFPEIGRNMRKSDLLVFLRPDGETQHRQHAPHGAFIDGHCATIVAALREHQLSPDSSFLQRVWPKVKLATNWLINRIDPDHDGVPAGRQPNTYDCDVSGANTFIGSQYLAALSAAVWMARIMRDREAVTAWLPILRAGMRNQHERLWNGEYYIQIPEKPGANDYNTGCHSDQLLGQWWAHQLGLGYLYPVANVRSALTAIMKYNYRSDFRGFRQFPRRYVIDSEGGLLTCTWPRGGRPDPFIIYADEVWTGIEYAVAGLMMFE